MITYQQARYQQYLYHETCPYSKDWNWNSPYTNLKAHYYMEGASLLVYLLQYTSIHPNYITILYALLGVAGGWLIATGVPLCMLIGILLMFNRGIVDLSDGHLARLKGKQSVLGAKLDLWAGRIGTYAFYLGVAIYVYKINPYILVYFIPLMFFKSKGRACIIDLICLLIILSIYLGCGNKEGILDMHHLDHNSRNSDLNNLITICRSCHIKHHKTLTLVK